MFAPRCLVLCAVIISSVHCAGRSKVKQYERLQVFFKSSAWPQSDRLANIIPQVVNAGDISSSCQNGLITYANNLRNGQAEAARGDS